MLDPRELYSFETDTDVSALRASVLVVAFGGYLDAGGTQRLLVDHLLSTLQHSVVATFDIDQLFDYRGRRPVMTFERDRWTAYEDPTLVLYRVLDDEGVPFLLLSGREPDYQWERVVEAVRGLIDRFGVSLTVTVYGIPMAVPHTRPLWVSAHATHDYLVHGRDSVFGTVKVPAGAQNLLELRLGEAGHQAVGYAVHVPHYVAQSDYPAAALAGLENLIAATGLALPDAALQIAAADTQRAIAAEVAKTEDAPQVVEALEEQYDGFVAGRQRKALLAGDDSLIPTADELGAEFEQFLRQQDGPEGSGKPAD
ncbi:MAG: PAC2 family protein [Austwickia sp.]|nr:PAC2 family protein [Actinomycetota bacterium]MCB1252505.1 PAC2 family protein [Austwickia sp.]MCO5310184.1 PAC2 family protein [Austwickia sp.]